MSTPTAEAAPITIDPVTASIVRHGLDAAADQALVALKRTAFSPLIYDVLDGAGAFYDRKFRMISQMTCLPMFTGSLGLVVQAVVEHYEQTGEGIQEGDVIVVNDPWITGTHQWDVAVVVPGFLDGEIVCYAAIKAHHMDVGAMAPFVTESTDVFQEGTIWPGVKMWRGGKRDDDLYRMFLSNTRLPDSGAGDLNAQQSACQAGLRAILELIRRYGVERFEAAIDVILDAGEAKMRQALAEFPKGRFSAEIVHEHNGRESVMLPFEVAVEFSDDGILIDLTDAPPAQPGPVNVPGIQVISGVRCALMALAIHDGGRANEGYFRLIKVKTTPGSMLDAQRPSPVALGTWPMYIVIEGIYEAIANAVPNRRPAGYDMVVSIFAWGLDRNDQPWIDGINVIGGAPAAPQYGDGGGPLMPIACSGVRGLSWEVWEAKTPMLVEQTEYATDSFGVGRHRGGPGMEIVVKALRPVEITLINERSQVPPFALDGGEKGRRSAVFVESADGEVREYIKETALPVPEGAKIRLSLSGGPGVGPASDRPAEAVLADVAAGMLSEERAREKHPAAFA